MAERYDGSHKSSQFTVLHSEEVAKSVRENTGLIIPQGSRALLQIGTDRHNPHVSFFNTEAITLHRDFEGAAIAHLQDTLDDTQRVIFRPDSEERRNKIAKIKEIDDLFRTPEISLVRGVVIAPPDKKPWVEEEVAKKTVFEREISKIDKQLATEFLEDRQDLLEEYNFFPDSIRQISLQLGIDQKIEIPIRRQIF